MNVLLQLLHLSACQTRDRSDVAADRLLDVRLSMVRTATDDVKPKRWGEKAPPFTKARIVLRCAIIEVTWEPRFTKVTKERRSS